MRRNRVSAFAPKDPQLHNPHPLESRSFNVRCILSAVTIITPRGDPRLWDRCRMAVSAIRYSRGSAAW